MIILGVHEPLNAVADERWTRLRKCRWELFLLIERHDELRVRFSLRKDVPTSEDVEWNCPGVIRVAPMKHNHHNPFEKPIKSQFECEEGRRGRGTHKGEKGSSEEACRMGSVTVLLSVKNVSVSWTIDMCISPATIGEWRWLQQGGLIKFRDEKDIVIYSIQIPFRRTGG